MIYNNIPCNLYCYSEVLLLSTMKRRKAELITGIKCNELRADKRINLGINQNRWFDLKYQYSFILIIRSAFLYYSVLYDLNLNIEQLLTARCDYFS